MLPLPPASVNACDAGAMAKEHTGDGSTGDLDDSHPQDDTHTLPMPRAAYTMVVLPMATPSNALSIADSATRAPGQRVSADDGTAIAVCDIDGIDARTTPRLEE
jgi:hypothetical protein